MSAEHAEGGLPGLDPDQIAIPDVTAIDPSGLAGSTDTIVQRRGAARDPHDVAPRPPPAKLSWSGARSSAESDDTKRRPAARIAVEANALDEENDSGLHRMQ